MSTSIRTMLELPLLNFFTALGEYDRLSLGRQSQTLDEYLLALELLDQGYGLVSKEDLYSLCKLLWFKPYHTEKAFRQLFETYLAALIREIRARQLAEEKEPAAPENNKEEAPTSDDQGVENEVKEKKEEETENKNEDTDQPAEPETPEPKEDPNDQVSRSMQKVMFKYELPEQEIALQEQRLSYQDIKQYIYKKKYILRGDYFPLKSRQMQQSFQLIREVVQEGRKEMIDWEATIQQTAKDAGFFELQMSASSSIRSGLTVLVDQEGSMVAFEELTQRMVEALQNYVGKKTQVFYFQNCPVDYLYENKNRTKAHSLRQFADGKPRTIIIVSDGGAARGGYNPDRLEETVDFLKSMSKHRMVWLNPMPEDRWRGTTADYIRSLIGMYEMNERGFVHAIKALKHRHRARS